MIALFWFTIRQTLWQRRTWVTLLLLAGPCALMTLLRHFGDSDEFRPVWERFHGTVQLLTFNVVIPLICILHGTALIGSEAEGGTLVYLVTRRLRRATVLVVKFAAASAALVVLVELSLAAQYACALWGIDVSALGGARQAQAWQPLDELMCYLRVAPMAVLAFGAVFALIALLTARPLAASILYFVIVEMVVGNLPLGARVYSVTHQLRRSMFSSIPGLGRFHELSAEQVQQFFPPDSTGTFALLGVVLVSLALAGVLVSTRELVPAKVARE